MASNEGKILLTGATGFIGSEVFARLARKIPLDRIVLLGRRRPDLSRGLLSERLQEHGLKSQVDPSRVVSLETDFLDAERFRRDLERLGETYSGPWTVVHLAALIHGKGEQATQERVNIGVTRDLLDWLNARGGHFVFTSSMVAFGATTAPQIRSERDFETFPPESRPFDYFRTKRDAHLEVLANAEVPVTILCPSIVHGRLENYKDSRGHLKALREGRLGFAPSGGGNFVSLESVGFAITEAVLGEAPVKPAIRLLVDRNLRFTEYFSLYTRLARGERAQRIRSLPDWLGPVFRGLFRLLKACGIYVAALDGAAQGSLYLYFRSEGGPLRGPPIEEAIVASLEAPKTLAY